MATRRFGISRGKQNYTSVVEGVGAAVNADTVEVTIDLAGNMSRADFLRALDAISNYVMRINWPPA